MRSLHRRAALALPFLALAGGAAAQTPGPRPEDGRWVVERDPRLASPCRLLLRNPAPPGLVVLMLQKLEGDAATLGLAVRDFTLPERIAATDRVSLAWQPGGATEELAIGEWRVIRRAPQVVMAMLPLSPEATARLVAAAGAAQAVELRLPGFGPAPLPATGFAEAWPVLVPCPPPASR